MKVLSCTKNSRESHRIWVSLQDQIATGFANTHQKLFFVRAFVGIAHKQICYLAQSKITTLTEMMFAWIHYWKSIFQEKLHAAMAWKQRRRQYQVHFLILEILSKKWKLSIMQIKYWNPRKTDTISKAVSGRASNGINSVPDLIYPDLVTCLSILKYG